METVICNLCGGNSFRTVYQLADWLLDRPNVKTTLVKCNDCGLIFQNPRPTTAEMEPHYPKDYEPYQSYRKKKLSSLMQKVAEYGLQNRARAIVSYKRSGVLLDIGCAAGDFLGYFQRKYGWSVQGVELSAYAAEQGRQNYGLKIFTGTLEQAKFQENSFDAITMWDVLEHLHDPASTLKEIYRILKPGGVLALRVPNADSFDARLFGPYWSGLDSPRHLYVFDMSTIRKQLKKNSFDVLSITSKHGSYMSFAISYQMWLVGKNVKPSTRETLMQMVYHPITRAVTAPLFFVYSLFQRTSNMMVVAKVKK